MLIPFRHLFRQVIPPVLTEAYQRRYRRVRFTGDYATWQDATAASTGYDTQEILNTVLASARQVRDGLAAYERDGVAFQDPAYVWPVVACLLREAAKRGGKLRVMDFGGALGSLYFQHRSMWRNVVQIRWAVVEQGMFVEAGAREFASTELSFHADIDAAIRDCAPDVALLSGVVGWVENPHALLADIVRRDFAAVVLDRCALIPGPRDRLTVQHVPPHIYAASYPAWLMARDGIMRHFGGRYDLHTEFAGQDMPAAGAQFGGFYFERRA